MAALAPSDSDRRIRRLSLHVRYAPGHRSPRARSASAFFGSFAFATPDARRTPTVPSSIALATSFAVLTPAPERTLTRGCTFRIGAPAPHTTSGFPRGTLT